MIDATQIKQVLEKAAIIKDQVIVIKLSEIIIADEALLINFAQ